MKLVNLIWSPRKRATSDRAASIEFRGASPAKPDSEDRIYGADLQRDGLLILAFHSLVRKLFIGWGRGGGGGYFFVACLSRI